jgi:hypothetical protein
MPNKYINIKKNKVDRIFFITLLSTAIIVIIFSSLQMKQKIKSTFNLGFIVVGIWIVQTIYVYLRTTKVNFTWGNEVMHHLFTKVTSKKEKAQILMISTIIFIMDFPCVLFLLADFI